MKEFPGLKVLFVLLFPLLFGACAVDRPPTGGPPDNTSLSVTASIPETGTVNTSPQTIQLDFSHYVSREALAKSIYFSPSVDDFEVSVHGREARIRIYSPLKQNRTYTLTLRNDLKSIYGDHRLDKSWALSFSTGPVIDNGSIEGQVWTPRMSPAANVTVMAFSPANGTSLPGKQSPEYLTQTGPSGAFRFEHLAPANYRIVAITDSNGNLRYDPESESFAVAAARAVAPDAPATIRPINLRLSDGSQVGPTLRSCQTINNREIEVTFNRPVPSESIDSWFSIENTTSGKPLPILGYFSLSRSSDASNWRLLTGKMNKESWYRLRFSDGQASSTLTFYGNDQQERYPALSLAIIPADGAESVITETIRPGSAPAAELRFNLPVVESSLTPGVVNLGLVEPTGTRSVACTITRIDSRTYAVRPSGGFLRGRSYTLRVDVGKINGIIGGMATGAQAVTSNFDIAGEESYGEINGTGKAMAPLIVIEAQMQDSKFMKRLEVKPSTTTGEFSFGFKGLPPGRYVLSAFSPSASSTSWSAGSVEPFAPADAFTARTVEVRAGWSTDDVRLDLPLSGRNNADLANKHENN
ncbi:conserved hypothetical protein [Chlorobaculum parvum NCIB 8327]|uniref:SbsA Ig-like domain-containing protein n=1 Tax=Chlorobaculum parvum (strain DSM 263 / NCIMB 8327) TaxID=517417 RepID=B3QQZ9_CHLP8|nr:Ig-like domain-containing protein [Chlorobaculum parvum]ACF10653.1 conserved hypothetical protein [Chlorobaculum parvum NCIB 8327]